MALTITGLIAKALAAQSPRLVVLGRITDQDSDDWYFSSGTHPVRDDSTYIDYVQNLHSISPIMPQIDPITRATQTSAVTVTLVDDGWIRWLMASQPLKNATMTLQLTTVEDNAGSTVALWKGVIADVVPMAGYIEIRCEDPLTAAFGNNYYGLLMNRHPLEIVDALLEAAGVPAAFRDSTTLDPDYDTTISHFVINCRWTPATTDQTEPAQEAGVIGAALGSTVAEDSPRHEGRVPVQYAPSTPIGQTIADIAFLCYGTIMADEDGEVGFRRFDSTASVDDTWTAEDIVELRQLSTYSKMINEVQVSLGDGEISETYIHRDTDSQGQHEMVGSSIQNNVLKVSLPLANQPIWLADAISDSATAGVKPFHLRLSGMCGTRVEDDFRSVAVGTAWADVEPFTQVAAAQLSAARKLWIKAGGEILTATGQTFTTSATTPTNVWDLDDIDRYGEVLTTHSFYPLETLLSGVTRGVAGAAEAHTASNPGAAPCYDITIARYLAAAIVDRAANGIPILEVVTSFAKYATQVGDLVDLTDDFPLWWDVDGVSSANQIKWEVISKEFDPLGEPQQIRWMLAYAAIDTPPWSQTPVDDPIDPEYQPDASGAPAVNISLTSDQSVGKAWTVIEFDTADWEQGTGLDLTTYSYTAGVSGPHHIEAQAGIQLLDAASWMQIAIYIDAVLTVLGPRVFNDSAAARPMEAQVSAPHQYLNVGEVVTIRMRHNSAANETIDGDPTVTFFSCEYTG